MATRYGGRQKGTPNKATQAAREAISEFVDGNAHRLVEWLDRVSEGVYEEETDPETGETVRKCVVPPNPQKAFEMFQSVIEYHVPKLGRVELAGDPDAPLKVDAQVNLFGELLDNFRMKRQAE